MGIISKIFGKARPAGKVEYNIPRVSLAELDQYPDAIKDIFRRRLDGIIVAGVISPEEREAAIRRILDWETDVIEPADFGKVYGKTLTGAEADLTFYLEQNPSFTQSMADLFGRPWEDITGGVMARLAGGREVRVPEVEGRGLYKSATIRFLEPGMTEMRAHIGNEFITGLPQCEHIASIVQLTDQLSYFVMLQKPEAGGELVLYDLTWDRTPKHMIRDKAFVRIPEERKAELERKYASEALKMEAGDLLLFHGGRIWHRVSRVEGSRPRITVGGFAAFSRDDRRIYYWS